MSDNTPDTFFYHSFPRRFRDPSDQEFAAGLKILSAIREFGLVLTPEATEWREPLSDGTLGKLWRVIQKRCSFTELAPDELPAHAQAFGRFSLEFDHQTFRELGGIPVFYLPRASEEDRGLESMAAAILARTGEIQVLLDRLSELATLVETTEDKSQLLVVERKGEKIYTRGSLGAAEDVIAVLTQGSQPVEILRNALRVLSGFFYPAEDFEYTGPLAHYRQREWRFVANMSRLSEEIDRDLTREEIRRLLEIDTDFFGRELEFHTGRHRRVDQCRLLSDFESKPILQYARRVVVPEAALVEATEVLDGFHGPRLVTLEELDKAEECCHD